MQDKLICNLFCITMIEMNLGGFSSILHEGIAHVFLSLIRIWFQV